MWLEISVSCTPGFLPIFYSSCAQRDEWRVLFSGLCWYAMEKKKKKSLHVCCCVRWCRVPEARHAREITGSSILFFPFFFSFAGCSSSLQISSSSSSSISSRPASASDLSIGNPQVPRSVYRSHVTRWVFSAQLSNRLYLPAGSNNTSSIISHTCAALKRYVPRKKTRTFSSLSLFNLKSYIYIFKEKEPSLFFIYLQFFHLLLSLSFFSIYLSLSSFFRCPGGLDEITPKFGDANEMASVCGYVDMSNPKASLSLSAWMNGRYKECHTQQHIRQVFIFIFISFFFPSLKKNNLSFLYD